MSKKVLTINELVQQPNTAPIWVLNTSDSSKIQRSAGVIIDVPNPNGGQSQVIRVPKTWLPTDLTTYRPRSHILESTAFRDAIRGNLIKLITDSYAKSMLSTTEAKKEQERLRLVEHHFDQMVNQVTTSDDDEIIDTSAVNEDELLREEERRLDVSFVKWVDYINTLGDKEAASEIRVRRRFKASQVRYLIRRLEDKTGCVKLLEAMLNNNKR